VIPADCSFQTPPPFSPPTHFHCPSAHTWPPPHSKNPNCLSRFILHDAYVCGASEGRMDSTVWYRWVFSHRGVCKHTHLQPCKHTHLQSTCILQASPSENHNIDGWNVATCDDSGILAQICLPCQNLQSRSASLMWSSAGCRMSCTTHCNTLQHTTLHRTALQHTKKRCLMIRTILYTVHG